MRSSILPVVFLLGSGCGWFEDLKSDVEGLTNPLVVSAIYLGIAEPESDEIDLSNVEGFDKGTTASAYLADAKSSDEMDESAIAGAPVSFKSSANGTIPMEESSGGAYQVTGDDGLEYTAGEDAIISATLDDEEHRVVVEAPPPGDAGLSSTHTAGQALDVSLEGQGFDSMLVVAFDTATGELTYSNQPDSASEWYDFTHGDETGLLAYSIPGSALSAQTVYAVGVAGLYAAEVDSDDGVNTALSSFLAGKMRFTPVSTIGQ